MEVIRLGDNAESSNSYWFVGAVWEWEDQLDRFLADGIWQNGYDDRYLDKVRSMQPGDRIAIKSSYTRKSNVPFETNGHMVSVMALKALGTIVGNEGDGRTVKVDWDTVLQPEREWYFYTYRQTIWKVMPNDWRSNNLIDFAFGEGKQDIDRFRNDLNLKDRFGDGVGEKKQFVWTSFYEEVATKLLGYKERRAELCDFALQLADEFELSYIKTLDTKDFCPFTFMGMFNRGLTEENRKAIATKVREFLKVEAPVPDALVGIPLLNNQKSWFFGYAEKRDEKDIDNLWEMFSRAIEFADEIEGQDELHRAKFREIYNQVASQSGVGWKLSMALFWIRPWVFVTLDRPSQEYIKNRLELSIGYSGPKGRSSGEDYLSLVDQLLLRFEEESYPVHSFPELSLAAWKSPVEKVNSESASWKSTLVPMIDSLCKEKGSLVFERKEFHDRYLDDLRSRFPNNSSVDKTVDRIFQTLRDEDLLDFLEPGVYRWLGDELGHAEDKELGDEPDPYSLQDIVQEGAFLDLSRLELILARLKAKKNLILQGPPGTGKTWLAKRLAFSLIGQRADRQVRSVQFHTNLSYEDFIRGWRPAGEGRLELLDGPFLQMINEAKGNAEKTYVCVIEEINRGNPAQIFGEMLTLLEADKRTPSEALELSYSNPEKQEKVHIPSNLYVIGTMNVADRSLALVDLALRRRFAFVDLEPLLNDRWFDWLSSGLGLDEKGVATIQSKMDVLNEDISNDHRLGRQFRIGHSYVTPSKKADISDPLVWFADIVNTEIAPLLEEYWFDDPESASRAQKKLLDGL